MSPSAFYAWREAEAAGPSAREVADAELVTAMRAIHDESDSTYGSPRMTDELARQGHRVNHKRVERLMRVNGIVVVDKAAKVRTLDLVGRRSGPGGAGCGLGRGHHLHRH